jgi:lipopolysaccharide export system permease protein
MPAGKACSGYGGGINLRKVRLLDRYLFRELLTPLAYCLGGFLVFYTSFDLFTRLPDLQEHKLHLGDVLEYAVAQMPGFLVLVLPVALLLALLYSLTHHARYHELTAMRAAGISLWRICLPYFAVGLAATAAAFALNELLVPRSADWAFRIKTRYVQTADDQRHVSQSQPFGVKNEGAHRLWYIREYNPRTAEMRGVTVHWPMPDGSSRLLSASRAVRTNGVWTFFGDEYQQVTEWSQADPHVPALTKLLQTNVLAMPEFDETPKQVQGEIQLGNSDILNPDTENLPLRDIWEYLKLNPHLPKARADELMTIFHGRLAAPWTCLVVVFIAIPFGAGSGRRNLFFGVAGSIFIVAGYLVAQKLSLAMGSNGVLPPWLAAWLPNLLFATLGLILTARVR